MRYFNVLVTKNPMDKCSCQLPLHELPIVALIHPLGEPEIKDRLPQLDRETPDADEEYERLARVYGDNGHGQSFVALAYPSVNDLADALEALDEEEAEERENEGADDGGDGKPAKPAGTKRGRKPKAKPGA